MLGLFASLLIIAAIYAPIVVNGTLYRFGIHIVVIGAIFRLVARFFNRMQSTIALIVAGFIFDSFNFSENFGASILLALFLHGLHMSITDMRANFSGHLDFIAVQIFNLIFFLYALVNSNRGFFDLATWINLALSQISVCVLDILIFSVTARLAKFDDKNPFQVAQNFFQK
jgi:hypothetical protein